MCLAVEEDEEQLVEEGETQEKPKTLFGFRRAYVVEEAVFAEDIVVAAAVEPQTVKIEEVKKIEEQKAIEAPPKQLFLKY